MKPIFKDKLRFGKTKHGFAGHVIAHPYRYVLLLPAVIYTLIYSYGSYPYIIIAFKRFNYRLGVAGSPFTGFSNFEFFFKSNAALTVIRNTLVLNILFLIFTTLFAMMLAIMLNEIRLGIFKKICQSIMLFPHYLSWVVIGYMIYGIFSMDFGILNRIISAVGGKPVNWFTNADAWPAILVIMRVWKGTGINTVIFLAAITGIDTEVYEAADIDGAGRLQRIFFITIPLLMPTVCILTILSLGKIMYGDFGMFYAIIGDNGILYPTTDIIDTYIFRVLRQTGNPSQAMAISLFQSIIGFVMVFGSNRLVSRLFPEAALF
jgi:putative aldouronate transport system permease protein